MAAVDGAFRASDLAEELMSVDKPNLLIASAFRRLVGSVDDISTADAVLWLRIGIGTAEEEHRNIRMRFPDDLKKRCMGLRQMLRTRRIVIIIHDKETHLGKSRKIFREILFASCAAGKTHVTVVRIQPSADDTGVSISGSGCASALCNRGTVKYDRLFHGILGCFP